MMIRKLGLAALVSCALWQPAQAQTVDESVAQLKAALDWSGSSRSNRDGMSSVMVDPDGCNFRLTVRAARDGSKFVGKLAVPFRDLDPGSLNFKRHRSGIAMRIVTKNNRDTVSLIGKVAGGQQLKTLRREAALLPDGASCDARSCTIPEIKDAIPRTYIGAKSTDKQRTIAQAFQTLERLCRRGG